MSELEMKIMTFGRPEEIRLLRISDESTNRMNEFMIDQWNSVVKPGDIIYHLGDIFLGKSVEDAKRIKNRLNGTIRLVLGNHDGLASCMRSNFDWIKDYYLLRVRKEEEEPQKIALFHYALRTWDGSHRKSWSLFGHSHGTLQDDPYLLSLDVGVDCHNFLPISYEDIKEKMESKRIREKETDERP